MRLESRFTSLFLLALFGATQAQGADWLQWRGPKNDGNSSASGVPTKWSAEENIAWKAKLPGMGGSTPILVGDQIFLTSAAKERLVLLALSTKDGKENWRADLGQGTPLGQWCRFKPLKRWQAGLRDERIGRVCRLFPGRQRKLAL